jgi:hypothetical protein
LFLSWCFLSIYKSPRISLFSVKALNGFLDFLPNLFGNVSVLNELPQDLAPYNDTFIFIKNEGGAVTQVYYIQNETAILTRFTTSNVTVSETEPQAPLNGDLWFDI